MQAIKIWIVEDDEDWRRGLVSYLNEEPDLQVKLASGDPDQVRGALARTEGAEDSLAPDVVLMDIMLHGLPEGIALAEEVAVAAGARVIMLTSMEEKDLILRSFQAGAIDYQLKTDFEGLPEAIRGAARREAPISPAAASRMREEFKRLKALEREFEVKKMQDLITPRSFSCSRWSTAAIRSRRSRTGSSSRSARSKTISITSSASSASPAPKRRPGRLGTWGCSSRRKNRGAPGLPGINGSRKRQDGTT